MYGYDDDYLAERAGHPRQYLAGFVQVTLYKSERAAGPRDDSEEQSSTWWMSARASRRLRRAAPPRPATKSSTTGGAPDAPSPSKARRTGRCREGNGISRMPRTGPPGSRCRTTRSPVYMNQYQIAQFAARLGYEYAVARPHSHCSPNPTPSRLPRRRPCRSAAAVGGHRSVAASRTGLTSMTGVLSRASRGPHHRGPSVGGSAPGAARWCGAVGGPGVEDPRGRPRRVAARPGDQHGAIGPVKPGQHDDLGARCQVAQSVGDPGIEDKPRRRRALVSRRGAWPAP